ncbi:alpha-L RNA-binding motif-containing protein [Metschnikowia bicuspidata var. bicuspidata NRRL YB-4993]|uniref:Small ribosomal subunit protein uS4m n=1 Tax=Metschnikowia bicuspidata var. bicuspidata NRRL YB-4993 TaxID=869754 RepID=A0A1A0HI10_9ASCO|nr:alpha-L RNA-binding motif-containing protein [Metschnikowia bicuspidata var. bicuspidata NRRL YB-4993]OBA23645.1 alpha-L RNA-binding motif-containing protein [Metschnikowia bicuspidata var. bicuspidata NRRL YB-4993]
MPRKAENLFSTARGRVRASMNKYNLFNLYKKQPIRYQGLTLFQQKWKAKRETRAYHGEHLTESRWKTLFLPKLESVAQLDASLKGVNVFPTPMSLQTFAVLEKRLEFALFRSMFASSVRQAREFIRSGSVQVNGVTIRHPAYPLQSGDIFSVTPEKVMLAMGRVKPSVQQAVKVDNQQIAVWNKYVSMVRQNPKDAWDLKQMKPASLNTLVNEDKKSRVEKIKKANAGIESDMLQTQKRVTRQFILKEILQIANGKDVEELIPEQFLLLVSSDKTDLAKCIEVYKILKKSGHDLVAAHLIDDCTKYISTKSTEFGSTVAAKEASNVKKILSEIVNEQLERIRRDAETQKLPEDAKTIPFTSDFGKSLQTVAPLDKDAVIEDESKAVVNLPWQKGLFGRQDPSKPFFTPWTPRPFIGAFAILPHHIEVSFETCHAIYLNDPVARPGHSEVISPFPDHVHERSYMYYVRKGL